MKIDYNVATKQVTLDGNAFRYRQSAGTAKWTPRTGAKNVNQYACFFVKRGGVWTGGKFTGRAKRATAEMQRTSAPDTRVESYLKLARKFDSASWILTERNARMRQE